jgi:hypothetical protein
LRIPVFSESFIAIELSCVNVLSYILTPSPLKGVIVSVLSWFMVEAIFPLRAPMLPGRGDAVN